MTTTSAQPFPSTGLRSLSRKETLQRAKSLNCTVPKENKPSCTGQLDVGIFFDGTGNNRNNDFLLPPIESRKHSNIVKLLHTFPEDRRNGKFRFYIPGVGTPFPEIKDDGILTALGGPFAWNGENRVLWAFTRLINAVSLFVTGNTLIDGANSSYVTQFIGAIGMPSGVRRTLFKQMQQTLQRDLQGKKPEIELINLSVFGFSRGAAEARAFSNWLFEVCEKRDEAWIFAGIPIRVGFLGIFDTVASVGIPNSLPELIAEGHQSWADGNMHINPGIEKCVHFVAAHEVRASFPLDSVRTNNKYPENAKEVMYPGAHSDLGGGYAPNDLGISPSNKDLLATIPGAHMYHEACKAGVALKPWVFLSELERADLTPSKETIDSLNGYLRSIKVAAGTVEDLHRHHMSLYLSYRYKYRNRSKSLPFYQRASEKHRRYIDITSATFNERLRNLHSYHIDPSVPHIDTASYKNNSFRYNIDPSDEKYALKESVETKVRTNQHFRLQKSDRRASSQLLEVLKTLNPDQLTGEIEGFFGNYIHDSMAGFIEMSPKYTNEYRWNGQGILRFRKIFKEDG